MSEEKKKKPIGKIVIGVLVVLVVLGIAGGAGGSGSTEEFTSSTSDSSNSQKDDQGAPAAKYEITDEVLDESGYLPTIKGTLTNNSGSELGYIQVEYVVYDLDGAQVATALANTTNLKADGVWKFEAGIFDTDVEIGSYELVDVTAY